MIIISLLCVICAKFETVDLAEIAAKKVKNQFDDIREIKIRYKNMPDNELNFFSANNSYLLEASRLPIAGANPPIGYPAYSNFYYTAEEHDNDNLSNYSDIELDSSTESTLMVKTPYVQRKQIASLLRSLGGLDISSSQVI